MALPDADRAEACRGIDPVQARRERGCGWAKPVMSELAEPGVEIRWIGNHTINRTKVVSWPGSVEQADLIDRWKMRIGTSTGPQETEESWDTAGCGRFIGRKDYDASTKDAPIRVIRMAQGTQSGAGTTRTDLYYGNLLYTRIRLRVHHGVGPLHISPELLSARTGATINNAKRDPGDVVDGQGVDIDRDGSPNEAADDLPAGSYDGTTGVYNWNLIDTDDAGDLLWFTRETRSLKFTSVPEYFYNDDGTSGADPPEIEAGTRVEARRSQRPSRCPQGVRAGRDDAPFDDSGSDSVRIRSCGGARRGGAILS